MTVVLSPKNPSPEPFLLHREGAQVFVVLAPGPAVADHFADGAPVRETAYGAVVDEEVGVKLAGADAGLVDFLAGIVAVDGEEFKAALCAEIDGFLQELAFASGPEDEPVAFFLKFSERCYGEGKFLADVGITVLNDSTVKIYCYKHYCSCVGVNTSIRSHFNAQVATTITPESSTTTLLSRTPFTLTNVPSRPSNWPPWMRTLTPLLRFTSSGVKKRRPSLRVLVTFMKLSICSSEITTILFFPSSVGM